MAIGTGMGMAIAAGAGLLGTAASSRAASGSNRDAARLEYDATQQALQDAREQREYERQQAERDREESRRRYDADQGRYAEERDFGRKEMADYRGRLNPFAEPGAKAFANVSTLLSRHLPGAVPSNARSGGMVTLQAPTGETREVPEAQAGFYLQQGARRVQ